MWCGVNFDLVAVFLFPFALLVFLIEFLDTKTSWHREIYRKIIHVTAGLIIISATYYLGYQEILFFALALLCGSILFELITFRSMSGVSRKSHGSIYFAVAFLLVTLFFGQINNEFVRFGIWLLIVPDTLAALIGSRWGKQIESYGKSILGSAVFFISALIVSYLFCTNIILSLALAIILTVVEFFSKKGIDNLLLPLVGSGLLYIFFI